LLIGGCRPGDSHCQNSNYKAQQQVDTPKKALKGVGMAEVSVWLRWTAASELEILERGQ
jgi:coenzyme F420-reducing hydrogenase delta subunit